MIPVVLSMVIAWTALMVIDRFYKKHKLKPEIARKLPHIVTGSIVAFWPFFISVKSLLIIAVIYTAIVFLSNYLGWFKQLRTMGRTTYGEIYYPLGIIVVCLLNPTDWIFAIALLHFAWADALAAIVGQSYGKKLASYTVWGQSKTVLGSLAFYAMSIVLIGGFLLFDLSYGGSAVLTLALVPLGAVILENLGIHGTDNFFVPVGVTLMLQFLA